MVFSLLRAFLSGDYSRVSPADLLSLTMSKRWLFVMRQTARTEE